MIHHYTSIQSLALILESKKIRFTRIDCLDDITEIDGLPNTFKTLAFVSCWTEDNIENISLWSLYTQMKGVRISFSHNIFNEYYIKAGNYGNWGYISETISPLPLEKIRTDNYLICNPFWLEDGFYKRIIYCEAPVEKRKELYSENVTGDVKIKAIQNLFIYKDLIWSFQNESRFYLIAYLLPPLNIFKDRETQMLNMNKFLDPIENSMTFIDVDINENAIDSIVVRLSPNSTYADKLIVESLIKRYTSKGIIELSNLKESIRSK